MPPQYVPLPLHADGGSPGDHPSTPRSPTLPPFSPTWPRHRRWRRRAVWALRPRLLLTLLAYVAPLVAVLVFSGWLMYEPHIEIAFYSRAWIQSDIEPVAPLAGCFAAARVSPAYNVSEAVYGPKRTDVQAGLPLRLGMDCYDFAGTIYAEARGRTVLPPEARTQFHTYWRSDLAAFGERQEWMLKSFFATQDLGRTRLVLWSNGDLSGNAILQKWRRRFPDAFVIRTVNYHELARGTVLADSEMLRVKDKKAWIDGDLVRLLVLWAYGGVWVDMDSLLTRDLAPLLEHEFVTQWDCYDKLYVPFNGALMRFHKHSPYLCEAFHIMVTSPPPRQGTTDWGATLYLKLWRRLVAASIPPFKVLPFCFTDGHSCRLDNRLPDPFTSDPTDGRWTMGLTREEDGGLDRVLNKVFSVHLHNQWEKAFPPNGWVDRLLLRRYDKKLFSFERTTRDEVE
ncbi:hypothetical protein CERSUDRAFT_116343 [Gelatoporia subvermispora B]|uniref:Glycosyltransferase family 32 protein n=1 Tax=Ceriporiopsis subvermispora (strain B) TaxID=914234 RepID=M2QEY5_CERS8|nr:hypothetical protein CERSUDRAFT_116343 [Gelatoporia subvermispora B]